MNSFYILGSRLGSNLIFHVHHFSIKIIIVVCLSQSFSGLVVSHKPQPPTGFAGVSSSKMYT